MPEPKPREASGLRKVDEPHPIAPRAAGHESKQASKQRPASQPPPPDLLVSITHRVPTRVRERLKIAAVRLGRREQDILTEALIRWLDEYEEGDSQHRDLG